MPQKPWKILLVSATEQEMPNLENPVCRGLVTGVGMVATTHALTEVLVSSKFDLVIDLGIAGSFKSDFGIGSVVQVVSDRLLELGVEDNARFIPADELGLVSTEKLRFATNERVKSLPEVAGITVNRVHGNAESIRSVVALFDPDIESMEGAAVAFVCDKFQIPWVQIRAISNKVEPRNKANWNVALALENLHVFIIEHLKAIENEA